jgi:hypothetical protein
VGTPLGWWGDPLRYRFELVDIGKLHPHEAVDEEALESFMKAVKDGGVLIEPILVAEGHLVILDGHHRYEALRRLGCKRVPAYLVDYDDGDIQVTTWPDAVVSGITKEDIVAMGLSGEVYPPKTSRHMLKVTLEEHAVPLEDLV